MNTNLILLIWVLIVWAVIVTGIVGGRFTYIFWIKNRLRKRGAYPQPGFEKPEDVTALLNSGHSEQAVLCYRALYRVSYVESRQKVLGKSMPNRWLVFTGLTVCAVSLSMLAFMGHVWMAMLTILYLGILKIVHVRLRQKRSRDLPRN